MITDMNVVKGIAPNGDCICEHFYNAKFSAIYTMQLFLCQHIFHCDFFNLRNMQRAYEAIKIGEGKCGHFVTYEGNDGVCYICIPTKSHNFKAFVGEAGCPRFDYEPITLKY